MGHSDIMVISQMGRQDSSEMACYSWLSKAYSPDEDTWLSKPCRVKLLKKLDNV
nr:hypothetical protein Iba_chr07aCG0720 [Ipomoea batatas]